MIDALNHQSKQKVKIPIILLQKEFACLIVHSNIKKTNELKFKLEQLTKRSHMKFSDTYYFTHNLNVL